jgi:FixJ family two-component response regulator
MSMQSPKVFIVDDDAPVRRALGRLLQAAGYEVESYESAASFLRSVSPDTPGCLLLDMAMPELNGLDVQRALSGSAGERPIVFLSGHYDLPSTVDAMKAGAVDFLTKPVEERKLLGAIADAMRLDGEARSARTAQLEIRERIASLTPREAEVFERVIHGRLNKQIAADLGTVEKTIKVHRARVMQKMRVRTLAELVSVAFLAGVGQVPKHRASGIP